MTPEAEITLPSGLADQFGIQIVGPIETLNGGNLHTTLQAMCEVNGEEIPVIFQRIRDDIFEIDCLENNFAIISAAFLHQLYALGLPYHECTRRCIVPFTDNEGKIHTFIDGGYWRAFPMATDIVILEVLENLIQAAQVGRAVADFHLKLANLDVSRLMDPLPGFHDIEKYISEFLKAKEFDMKKYGKITKYTPVRVLLNQMIQEINTGRLLLLAQVVERGEIPKRVTHNDLKITNFGIDMDTREPIIIFDWDTIKPLPLVIELADAFRSNCSNRPENATDYENIQFEISKFEAIAKAYLEVAKEFMLRGEMQYFVYGIELIARELAIRFFADYLRGNTYFGVEDTFERARNQWALAASIRNQMDDIIDALYEIMEGIGMLEMEEFKDFSKEEFVRMVA